MPQHVQIQVDRPGNQHIPSIKERHIHESRVMVNHLSIINPLERNQITHRADRRRGTAIPRWVHSSVYRNPPIGQGQGLNGNTSGIHGPKLLGTDNVRHFGVGQEGVNVVLIQTGLGGGIGHHHIFRAGIRCGIGQGAQYHLSGHRAIALQRVVLRWEQIIQRRIFRLHRTQGGG